MSFAFQAIAPGNDLEFAADGFFDRDDGVHLEPERREHRAEFVNRHQIAAFHQHVPAPLADSDHKEVDLEISRRLPLAEDFEDSLLGILVLHRRTLRAFEKADHVFHRTSSSIVEHLGKRPLFGRANVPLQPRRLIARAAGIFPRFSRHVKFYAAPRS